MSKRKLEYWKHDKSNPFSKFSAILKKDDWKNILRHFMGKQLLNAVQSMLLLLVHADTKKT